MNKQTIDWIIERVCCYGMHRARQLKDLNLSETSHQMGQQILKSIRDALENDAAGIPDTAPKSPSRPWSYYVNQRLERLEQQVRMLCRNQPE